MSAFGVHALPVVLFLTLTTFSTLSQCGQETVVTWGPCPFYKPKANLDLNRYRGLWYEWQRFPNLFEVGLDCVQAYYSSLPSLFKSITHLNVTNAGRFSDGRESVIQGKATPTLQGGTLLVTFPTSPVPAKYNVLDTDYETYASVYSCVNLLLFKVEFAWVLVRDPATTTADTIKAAVNAFSRNGVNTGPFQLTRQTGCNYVLDALGRKIA